MPGKINNFLKIVRKCGKITGKTNAQLLILINVRLNQRSTIIIIFLFSERLILLLSKHFSDRLVQTKLISFQTLSFLIILTQKYQRDFNNVAICTTEITSETQINHKLIT